MAPAARVNGGKPCLSFGLQDAGPQLHHWKAIRYGATLIRYSLRCADDHVFESWFRSADAFDRLVQGGDLACPECGSDEIEKAPMAPRVGSTETRSPAEMVRTLCREIERNSEYVGDRFATEARAIHDGVAPERAIWGEARRDEARKLLDDGIPVAPLPFVPQRKMN